MFIKSIKTEKKKYTITPLSEIFQNFLDETDANRYRELTFDLVSRLSTFTPNEKIIFRRKLIEHAKREDVALEKIIECRNFLSLIEEKDSEYKAKNGLIVSDRYFLFIGLASLLNVSFSLAKFSDDKDDAILSGFSLVLNSMVFFLVLALRFKFSEVKEDINTLKKDVTTFNIQGDNISIVSQGPDAILNVRGDIVNMYSEGTHGRINVRGGGDAITVYNEGAHGRIDVRGGGDAITVYNEGAHGRIDVREETTNVHSEGTHGVINTQSAVTSGGFFTPKAYLTEKKAVAEKKKLNVTEEEIKQFLDYVAKGAQDEAEGMLKKKPQLVLAKGQAKDHAGREFKSESVTGFQYAVWALDWHMWKMIKPYFEKVPGGREALKAQLGELQERGLTYRYEQWTWHKKPGNKYGNYNDDYIKEVKIVTETTKNYDCNSLTHALSDYLTKMKAWQAVKWKDSTPEAEACYFQWQKVVGDEQRLAPAHIANEYCRNDRSFVVNGGPPDFLDESLPRVFETNDGEWYSMTHRNARIGETCSCVRGSHYRVASFTHALGARVGDRPWAEVAVVADKAATRSVSTTRTQQRDELVREILGSAPIMVRF